MFTPRYPNLDNLEATARRILYNDTTFITKLDAAKAQRKVASVYLEAHVFPQVWGSTCLGFDVMPDGSPAFGGCAMTKAYTTVFHEASISDTYIVFFGDKPCYIVTDATLEFLFDLNNHNLKPLSKAIQQY